jgi:N-carbamoylputrescine amidase
MPPSAPASLAAEAASGPLLHPATSAARAETPRATTGHALFVPILMARSLARFYGSSFIANHRGDKVEELDREAEGVIVHTFDLNFLHRHRAAWGFFRDRRPELYGALATADGKLRV